MTGALIGRAVEPRAGEHVGGHDAHGMCLNCGTALIGAYCHACGQSGHVHRSLGAIGHEILHGVVHFEGKLWRTLPMLAWRPGELTRRYIAGERVRFVSPMALFLFSIFTLFAVFSMMGIQPPAEIGGNATQLRAGLEESHTDLIEARDDARRTLAETPAGHRRRAEREQALDQSETNLREFERALPALNASAVGSGLKSDTGWKRLDYGIEKFGKNPSLALYKLQTNSYKFSWLLIPLSLPFVWLMFAWKRQFHLYDHAVFVTYSIAFMSLLFILVTLLAGLGLTSVPGWIALLVPPWHIYRQLKGAYGLGRRAALLRTLAMLAAIVLIVGLFLLILLALGLLG